MPAPQTLNRSSCDALTQHLRAIGRIPLLTHEEEITLGRRVQTLRQLEEIHEELTIRADGRTPSLEIWAAEAGLTTWSRLPSSTTDGQDTRAMASSRRPTST